MPKLGAHFKKGDRLFGILVEDLRSAFSIANRDNGVLGVDFICHALKVDRQRAKVLLNELLEAGFVRPYSNPRGEAYYQLTAKGGALSKIHFRRWIKRATADAIVASLPDRIRTINESGDFLFSIRYLVLFGSYVESNDPYIPDIDAAIKVVERESLRRLAAPDQDKVVSKYAAHHGYRGEYDFIGPLMFARDRPIKALKMGCYGLDLTEFADPVFLESYMQGRTRDVYTLAGSEPLPSFLEKDAEASFALEWLRAGNRLS